MPNLNDDRMKFEVAEKFNVPSLPTVPDKPSTLVTGTIFGLVAWGTLLIIQGLFTLDGYMIFAGLFIFAASNVTRLFRKRNMTGRIEEWERMVEYLWTGNPEFTRMKNMFILYGIDEVSAERLATHSMDAWLAQETKCVTFFLNEGKPSSTEGSTVVGIYFEPEDYRKMRVLTQLSIPVLA